LKSYANIINATRFAGGVVFLIGFPIFLYGLLDGNGAVTGIGIGTVMGAVFIFLMGMFFVATEEMVANTIKGIEIPPANKGRVLYLVKKN
jgi:hypothetical protein